MSPRDFQKNSQVSDLHEHNQDNVFGIHKKHAKGLEKFTFKPKNKLDEDYEMLKEYSNPNNQVNCILEQLQFMNPSLRDISKSRRDFMDSKPDKKKFYKKLEKYMAIEKKLEPQNSKSKINPIIKAVTTREYQSKNTTDYPLPKLYLEKIKKIINEKKTIDTRNKSYESQDIPQKTLFNENQNDSLIDESILMHNDTGKDLVDDFAGDQVHHSPRSGPVTWSV